MSKPKAPEAPNYVAAAQAQGAANVDAARATAKLNNPNITNPYGTQTVKYGGDKIFDEAAYNQAMNQFNAQGPIQSAQYFDAKKYLAENPDVAANAKYGTNAYGHYQDWGKNEGRNAYWLAPNKDMFTRDSNPDQVDVIQELSPEGRQLFDQQNRISQGLGNLAEGGISRVGQMLGTSFDMSGIPDMSTGVDSRQGQIRTGIDPTGTNIQSSIDPRFDQDGRQVQEALYRKQTSMLDPQYQQQESDMISRLANQGIMPGSEAYNREMGNFSRARDFAYGNARDSAILAAGQEQSRLNDMGLSRATLNNSAQGQEFGQNATQAGFNNSAVAQMFGQDLSSAQFGNQARQQAIQEQAFLRQLPLNEINALRSGSQVNMPQFQQYTGGGQVAAAPIFGATQAQDQANIARYNADAAQKGGMMSGLFGLGSSALLGGFSPF